MASSKMFLNNDHDGDEWFINGWPHLSVMSGYSSETTYFVLHFSLTSAVLFICHVFSPYSLAPLVWFLYFSFSLLPILPPCSLLVSRLTCFSSPCWERFRSTFHPPDGALWLVSGIALCTVQYGGLWGFSLLLSREEERRWASVPWALTSVCIC